MLSKFLKQSSIDISCCRSSDDISCRCCFPPFRLDLVCLENNEWGHSQPPALTHETIVLFCGFSPLTVWKVCSPLIPVVHHLHCTHQHSMFYLRCNSAPRCPTIFCTPQKNFVICAGFAPIARAIDRFTAIFFLTLGNRW